MSQPAIHSPELNDHPVPNEEAVVSESSLSQNNTQSIRSTPASSFSIQRTSPKTEAQSSGLQHCEEIELSSTSSHGLPSENAGTNTLQPVPEESSPQHDPSTLAWEQDASANIPQPSHWHKTCTRYWQQSLHTLHQYMPNYEITSITIALLALALTAYFGYETYKLTLEGTLLSGIATGAQLYQTCDADEVRAISVHNTISTDNRSKEKGKGSEACKKVLGSPIGSLYIPDVPSIRRRKLGALSFNQSLSFTRSSRTIFVLLGLTVSVGFLIYICMAGWLNGGFVPSVRRRRASRSHRPNAFDPVPVRLNPQTLRNSAPLGKVSQPNQAGGREKVIHGLHEQTHGDSDRTSLESLQTSQEYPVSVRRTSTDSAFGQVGDALKGSAPDDLIFLPDSPSGILRRVFQKTSSKIAITSGVVAPGLVHAGSTLASSVGGGIGPVILIRSESSDKLDKITPIPVQQQDTVATGVEL